MKTSAASNLEEQSLATLDKVKETTADTVEKAKDYATDFAKQIQEAAENVPTLIRRYPYESLLASFGLGFVAAFMVRRVMD